MPNRIQELTELLVAELSELDGDSLITAINEVRSKIHDISPLSSEPVDYVRWVHGSDVVANDYNPNEVAPPEMTLLEHSIREDGYTQPIVVFSKKASTYEVVDGFHRNRVGKEVSDIKLRTKGYLPVTIINNERTEMKDRIAATIRHNRARGVHGITPMAHVVSQLYFNGWSNKRICKELGMEKDEVLRLKQFTGLGTLFENRTFSPAWDLSVLSEGGYETSDKRP